MKKAAYGYGLLIALSFLWTGSAFISVAYHMLDFFSPSQVDFHMSVSGYLLQALGMALVAGGLYFYPGLFKIRPFFSLLMVIEAVVITTALLSQNPLTILLLSFIMNILHGMVAGCYLTLMAVHIPGQYRGRAFGFGYAFGSLGSWLLSLPGGGSFLGSKGIIIVYPILIAITVFTNNKLKSMKIEGPDLVRAERITPGLIVLAFIVVLLLSFIKNLGFYFPVSDFAGAIDLEFSRLFYALGLIFAGILNDKSRRYGAICCLTALVFPFISLVLPDNAGYAAAMWILGYVFFSFFSVYRVVLFSDISTSKASFLPLATVGLLAGRMGDATSTLTGMRFSGNAMVIVTATSILFIFLIFLFFSLYQRLYIPQLVKEKSKEELIKCFGKKYDLTKRESEVLQLVLQGYSNCEITGSLFISESTVKFHIGNILKKTGTANRSELTFLVEGKDG